MSLARQGSWVVPAALAAAFLAGCGTPSKARHDGGVSTDAGSPDGGAPDAGDILSVPLSGCTASSYWTDVAIGSQTFQMLLDTGSATTAAASTACVNCDGVSPLYQPTSPPVQADGGSAMVSVSYGDGSQWSGTVYSDTVRVDSTTTSVSLDVAAIASQNGFFLPSACDPNAAPTTAAFQGILGLGPADLAASGTTAYFSQLVQTGRVAEVFATQLCGSSGTLWLGGYNPAATTGAPQYTPMVMSSYYAIGIGDLALGGASLGFTTSDFGPTLVDTGTSLVGLPQHVYNGFVNALENDTGFQQAFPNRGPMLFQNRDCVVPAAGLTKAQVDTTLPPLSLTLPGMTSGQSFTLDFPATGSYLFSYDQGGRTYYCPGLFPSSQTILGDALLSSNVTVFDVQHMRIGFAPAAPCP